MLMMMSSCEFALDEFLEASEGRGRGKVKICLFFEVVLRSVEDSVRGDQTGCR